MATRRTKSVKVADLLEWGNAQLAREDEFADQKFKAGVCVLLEKALHESGNYQGYNQIYWLKQGYQEWRAAGEPDFPEKEKYTFGEGGKTGTFGEYSRIYYRR